MSYHAAKTNSFRRIFWRFLWVTIPMIGLLFYAHYRFSWALPFWLTKPLDTAKIFVLKQSGAKGTTTPLLAAKQGEWHGPSASKTETLSQADSVHFEFYSALPSMSVTAMDVKRQDHEKSVASKESSHSQQEVLSPFASSADALEREFSEKIGEQHSENT